MDNEALATGDIVVRTTYHPTMGDDVPAGVVGKIVAYGSADKIRVQFINASAALVHMYFTEDELILANEEETLQWSLHVMKS